MLVDRLILLLGCFRDSMAGPRSTGCRKCVQRRVKCDEKRPACARCLKVGMTCPGYRTPYQFLDPIVADAESGPISLEHQPQAPRNDKRSAPVNPSDCVAVWYEERFAAGEVWPVPMAVRTSLRNSISLASMIDAQLLNSFLTDLGPAMVCTKFWLRWAVIPAEDDPTLNGAVRALASAYGSVRCQDGSLVNRSRHAYGLSLMNLRRAIVGNKSANPIVIQNAILALSMFECYDALRLRKLKRIIVQEFEGNGITQLDWRNHAKGLHYMMKLQGPQAYLDGPHRLVYIAIRDPLVSLEYSRPSTGKEAEVPRDRVCLQVSYRLFSR